MDGDEFVSNCGEFVSNLTNSPAVNTALGYAGYMVTTAKNAIADYVSKSINYWVNEGNAFRLVEKMLVDSLLAAKIEYDAHLSKNTTTGNYTVDNDQDNDGIDDCNDTDMDGDGMNNSYEDSVQSLGSWQNKSVYNARYAVLMCGGSNGTDNYIAFWNDIHELYDKLVDGYGYNSSKIYVLTWNYAGSLDGVDQSVDGIQIDGRYTYNNIGTVFEELSKNMTGNDFLFFAETSHAIPLTGGLNIYPNNTGEKHYSVLSETCGLRLDIKKINSSAHMVLVFQSCGSGHAIDSLSGANKIVISACEKDRLAYTEVSCNNEHFAFLHEGKIDNFILEDEPHPGFTPNLGTVNDSKTICYAFNKGCDAASNNRVAAFFGLYTKPEESIPQRSGAVLSAKTYL